MRKYAMTAQQHPPQQTPQSLLNQACHIGLTTSYDAVRGSFECSSSPAFQLNSVIEDRQYANPSAYFHPRNHGALGPAYLDEVDSCVTLDRPELGPYKASSFASLGSESDPVYDHAYRPQPREDGSLTVDPEIKLKALGGGLLVEFFFISGANTNGTCAFRSKAIRFPLESDQDSA